MYTSTPLAAAPDGARTRSVTQSRLPAQRRPRMRAGLRLLSPLENRDGPQRMRARLFQRELHQSTVESRIGPFCEDLAHAHTRQAEAEDSAGHVDPVGAAEGFDDLGRCPG